MLLYSMYSKVYVFFLLPHGLSLSHMACTEWIVKRTAHVTQTIARHAILSREAALVNQGSKYQTVIQVEVKCNIPTYYRHRTTESNTLQEYVHIRDGQREELL